MTNEDNTKLIAALAWVQLPTTGADPRRQKLLAEIDRLIDVVFP